MEQTPLILFGIAGWMIALIQTMRHAGKTLEAKAIVAETSDTDPREQWD